MDEAIKTFLRSCLLSEILVSVTCLPTGSLCMIGDTFPQKKILASK